MNQEAPSNSIYSRYPDISARLAIECKFLGLCSSRLTQTHTDAEIPTFSQSHFLRLLYPGERAFDLHLYYQYFG